MNHVSATRIIRRADIACHFSGLRARGVEVSPEPPCPPNPGRRLAQRLGEVAHHGLRLAAFLEWGPSNRGSQAHGASCIMSRMKRDPSLTIDDIPRIRELSEADERTVMRALLGGEIRGAALRRRVEDAIARVKAEKRGKAA